MKTARGAVPAMEGNFGLVQADRNLLRPIIKESSRQYAKEKNITPRDCSKEP